MAELEYYIEYDYGTDLPGEASAFIHLRLDLPAYRDRVAKEEYFSSLATGRSEDETVPSDGSGISQTFTLDYTAAFTGTIIGTLYKRLGGSPAPLTDTEIQTFTTGWDGELAFTDVGSPPTKAASGSFTVTNNKLNITFNANPADPYYFVVSYDYATGTPGTSVAFITKLFNVPGVIEVACQPYRLWLMKSPLYEWDEVLPATLELLRSTLNQDDISELEGSGVVVDPSLRRDLTGD